MESKEGRQIKSAFARLGRAIRKKYVSPEQQQKDQVWSTDIRARQRMEAAIKGAPTELLVQGVTEHFKGSGLTPDQVEAELKSVVAAYSKHYREEQEEKKQRHEEALKSWEFQKSPFYRICLGATFGVFGSYYGSSGQSRDGLKFAEEIKQYDTATLRDAIKRLRNRDLTGYPLQGYNSAYVEEVINYLTSLVISRGEPTEAPATTEAESLSALKKLVGIFRGH